MPGWVSGGVVLRRPKITTTISLNFGPDFPLRYHVSIFDTIHSRSLRFQDDYFKVLGLGVGGWKIDDARCLPEKMAQISDFGSWHVQEYNSILKDIVEL